MFIFATTYYGISTQQQAAYRLGMKLQGWLLVRRLLDLFKMERSPPLEQLRVMIEQHLPSRVHFSICFYSASDGNPGMREIYVGFHRYISIFGNGSGLVSVNLKVDIFMNLA